MAENRVKAMDDLEVDRTQDFSKDENEERGNWTGRLDYLLASLGNVVGLGNVWRFPYLCYQNGGGVFLIPYCVMLFLVGMPLYLLEVSLGQFTSRSALTCWEFAPIFKGVGVGMVFVATLISIYYNMVIAWALYYLVASFTQVLPWKTCGDWSGPNCRDNLPLMNETECTSKGYIVNQGDGTCVAMVNSSSVLTGIVNATLASSAGIKRILPSEEYFRNVVLGINKKAGGVLEPGALRWQLCVALLIAWLIVFLCMMRGIKSSGKVVYFTAIFPYVVLIILLVRGLTLPGYQEGINYYLYPDLSKLKSARVWKDAAVQIFFSLSAAAGTNITLASYNRFHNDVLRDTIFVSIGNFLTSFFAGFVIFAFLGFLAQELEVEVSQVVEQGPGLLFIVLPDAVTRLPLMTLWAILLFLMLITLGLDSEFALVETITTSIMDQFPSLHKRKTTVILCTVICLFFLGLLLCTEGGIFWLNWMDTYSGGWNMLILGLAECSLIGFLYGPMRFREDLGVMFGKEVCACFPWKYCSLWWMLCWAILTPCGILFILLFSWVDYIPLMSGTTPYPGWSDVLGWLMTVFILSAIFLGGSYMFLVSDGTCMERVKKMFNPTVFWGPALPQHRALICHWDINLYTPDDTREYVNYDK